jgi:predicted RNA-binding Zn-ribbon protein involved in translation (DUF1610 family)
MEFDMTKVVEDITMQAQENQEEFIFETINPYCENVLRMKISKEELKQILLNGIQKQQPCDDCISRKALINELKLGYFNKDLQEGKNDPCVIDAMIDWAIRTSKRLPSVTPQPKMGKWIHREDFDYIDIDKVVHEHYICKDCGFIHDFIDGHTGQYNYCPQCGAKMAESEDEVRNDRKKNIKIQ